jgi:alpha-mannosidase
MILAIVGLAPAPMNSQADDHDTCLMFAAKNIAKGSGNFYCYVQFSDQQVTLRKGDKLEYDIYLSRSNPEPKGGIDFNLGGTSLRGSGAVDQNNIRAHGDGSLPQAFGKWYHRVISLPQFPDQSTSSWNVQFESDLPGSFVLFLDNVAIVHADGSRITIYDGGQPAKRQMDIHEGYSQIFVLRPLPRSQVVDGADLTDLIRKETATEFRLVKLDAIQTELQIAQLIGKDSEDVELQKITTEALNELNAVDPKTTTDKELDDLVTKWESRLKGSHPKVKAFTIDLVGYGHIDFQWLWNWKETIEVNRATIAQALKFLDEYPNFKFTMSSSLLYKAIEESNPDLFKKVQEQVAKGRWEIVGGRMTEADTNIISNESHARQFLYGQAYYRDKFDKQSTVGFEPDTFGHTLQMPQILKLAGCEYYYFCRTGCGLPLFWWQSPDGSRVLTFDDEASGGWYNNDVNPGRFNNLFKYEKKSGKKETLWLYGVGDHGGGPTRENIEMALQWQAKSYLPTVRFSTLEQFFENVQNSEGPALPVHKSDLNTVFPGCYTSHSDVKSWNREAESVTEWAEALAVIASRFGYVYPRDEFRKNWEKILWNQHHDTIDGSAINSSYATSKTIYGQAIDSSWKIIGRAIDYISQRARTKPGDILVFNALGSDYTTFAAFKGKLDKGNIVVDGHPVQDLKNGLKAFIASDVPSNGYKVFHPTTTKKKTFVKPIYDVKTHSLENARYRVVIDPSRGVVTSLVDKRSGYDSISPGGSGNRLEIHWEKPGGMSAWEIQEIAKVEPLTGPVDIKVVDNGPVIAEVTCNRSFAKTNLVQTISLSAVGEPEFSLTTTWKELGSGDHLNPFLKVAFDVNANKPTQTYDIPFGTIKRDADGKEYPALKWVDFSDAEHGAVLINNNKHGYSAKGNTLYLSLIRSSYDPDPTPNNYEQTARWSFVPHSGSWKTANTLQLGQAFNHPLIAYQVDTPPAKPTLPASYSLISIKDPNLVVTGIKLAENCNDLIIRFYEAFGLATKLQLVSPFAIGKTTTVNLLEQPLPSKEGDVRPYEIRTLKIRAK